jgi:hypothetical protein
MFNFGEKVVRSSFVLNLSSKKIRADLQLGFDYLGCRYFSQIRGEIKGFVTVAYIDAMKGRICWKIEAKACKGNRRRLRLSGLLSSKKTIPSGD